VRSIFLNRGSQGLAAAKDIRIQGIFNRGIIDFHIIAILQVRSNRPLRHLPRHENLFPDFFLDQAHVSESLIVQRQLLLIRDFDALSHPVPFLCFMTMATATAFTRARHLGRTRRWASVL
jgi:hypothetical protein